MNRMRPVRTYERKRKVGNAESFCQLVFHDVIKRHSVRAITDETADVADDSLKVDPFETTFDKLAKNARLPVPLVEDDDNKSWLSSSYDNSNVNIDQKSPLQMTVNLPDILEVIPKKQKQDKGKQKRFVTKRKLRKKGRPVKDNNKSLQKQTNDQLKSQSKRKKKQNKENKRSFGCSELSLSLNTGGNTSSASQDHRNDELKKESNNTIAAAFSNMTNLSKCSINLKECTIRIEKLDTTHKGNMHVARSRSKKVISSTPIGKIQKMSTQLIPLSPIPINYSKKLNLSEGSISNNCISPSIENAAANNGADTGKFYDSGLNTTEKIRTCSDSTANKFCLKNNQEDGHLLKTELYTSLNGSDESIEESLTTSKMEGLEKTCNQNSIDNIHDEKTLLLISNRSKDNSINRRRHSAINKVQPATNLKQKQTNLRFSIASDRSCSLFDDSDLSNSESMSEVSKLQSTLDNKEYYNSTSTAIDSTQSFKGFGTTEIKTANIKAEEFLNSSQCNVESKNENEYIEERNSTENIQDLTNSIYESKCNESKLNSSNNTTTKSELQPCVLLTRLQDPVRITTRRQQYSKWNLQLTNIYEDSNLVDQSLVKLEKRSSQINAETNKPGDDTGTSVFLKPGKSWARSLSILNNIRQKCDLDELSVGKGRKWRHSVQDILDMQKQGVVQSCVKSNRTRRKSRPSCTAVAECGDTPITGRNNAYGSASLGHLSRRISIRVVPNKKSVGCVQDTTFLEAYGIVPRSSVDFTLLSSRRTSVREVEDYENVLNHTRATAREVVLRRCAQHDYMPFYEYFTDSYLSNCRKIGEGVYGEVFLHEMKCDKSVIKIIPIEGDKQVNGEPQKKFDEILSEILIAKELHNLRFNAHHSTDRFVEVKNIKCIKGEYPEKLVELWKAYDEEKTSDNDCPAMFNEDQLYIVLELGHGGQDLEAFVFNTAEEAFAVFMQAALALAVAEKSVEFEHRDLHWGNVLISRTEEPYVYYTLENNEMKLPSNGVKVSIIDFTLSRISYQGCYIFNDLALDPALFTAQGEYQFEIYRLMRDKVENDWQKFEPYTNILWLHYTLDKMITAVRYRKRTLKAHKTAISKLVDLKAEILSYESSFDFVTNCGTFTSMRCSGSKIKLNR